MTAASRKGAARVADVPPDIRAALEAGRIESKSLPEILAIDFAALLGAVFPDLVRAARARIDPAAGVTRRMDAAAALIEETHGADAPAVLAGHRSDTARGWGAYLIALRPDMLLEDRLARLRPFADDTHFGVREWAWLAARPRLAEDLDRAITLLIPWTGAASANPRRFAVESLRPRGVWSSHIKALKEDPERARPLLHPLRADPARYVQDSVANWLNDAGKTRPDWVRALCAEWQAENRGTETAYIVKRARRGLD